MWAATKAKIPLAKVTHNGTLGFDMAAPKLMRRPAPSLRGRFQKSHISWRPGEARQARIHQKAQELEVPVSEILRRCIDQALPNLQ